MGSVIAFSQAGGRGLPKPLWRHVLGEVLRGERLDQERILTEVAAAAGVSPQYLSEIERGRKEPSSEILGSVADALGLGLFDVVRRVGDRLGARLDEERREAERHERLVLEASLAFRADAPPAGASGAVYLLAA
ncbi:helix-turn-helix domain-containing protein [Agromyces bauzanensis]